MAAEEGRSVPAAMGLRRSFPRTAPVCLLALAALGLGGCNEVNGRRLIQKGNEDYREGRYAEAIAKFDEAAALIPNFPTLWLNKGFTCKRMIIPGVKTAENFKAANCAIKAFQKFKELVPDDPRGDMLYTQTLFDADRFSTIAEIYEARFRDNPRDKQTVSVLMQVYSKWDMATLAEGGKLDDALKWYRTSVEQNPDDPETYYSVGTFIYTQLMTKGGGTDKQLYDPRPGAVNKATPLPPTPIDILGEPRVALADEGIKYLERAVELRPTYTDAMTYLNLLWRQRSFAYFDNPTTWYENLMKAEEWKDKTLALLRERAAQAAAAENKDGDKPKGDIKLVSDTEAGGLHITPEEDEADEEEAAEAAPAKSKSKAAKGKKGRKGRAKKR